MELSELVESVDILAYIGQYTEFNEEKGEYWALSPLKQEETPSFSVNTDEQIFYDFSSGKGGDVLDFVRYYHRCGFGKAVKILSDYVGVDGKVEVGQGLEITKIAKRFRIRRTKKKSATYKPLTPDYMEQFPFDKGRLKPWIDEGIRVEELEKYKVRYDPLSNRILYPIKNTQGEIINVSARTLMPDFKERKIRKYTYLRKLGVLDTLYGYSDNIAAIREAGEIILFEGAKSVMKAEGWGYKNCCAILTSHLNSEQLRILINLGVRVVFALDADVNIREDKNILRLKRFVRVEWAKNQDKLLEDKMSPVDAGEDVWKSLYERRVRLR